MKTTIRTHSCGELTNKDVNKKVILCGWVHSSRDHGGVIFTDLRDRYGLTQLVFDPKFNKEAYKEAEKLKREFVIKVNGVVKARKKGMINKKIKTGEIEVFINTLEVLNESLTPPIEIDDNKEANEDLRLKYRYLDLRRPKMVKQLELRHKAAQAVREYFDKEKFIEVETPILVRATPEGARDYIVPSRVHPGKFYALPQSPQLYKQILMVSGFDRYYQLPRCLRDEDLRADRQPEHTQIDIEMSFITEEDIYTIIEGLIKHVFKKVLNTDVKTPFQRITHKEAMEKYGIDKPDLRFGLEIIDITEIAKESSFQVFKQAEKIKCINVPNSNFSRKEIDSLIEFATKNNAKGLSWIKYDGKNLESSIVKFFNEKLQKEIIKKTSANKDSLLLFIADDEAIVNEVLSKLRVELAQKLNLIKNEYKFCWVTSFPLFEWNEEEQRLQPCHHMFTMPKLDDIKLLEKDPGKVHGQLYDLVLNGVELGSGSIRIHRRDIQQKVMKVIGLEESELEHKFGFLLNAFKYGAPPHGGIALGFDRLTALMCNYNDIREVIAFPKNKAAQCPMDESPSQIDEKQLKEAHIKTDTVKSK